MRPALSSSLLGALAYLGAIVDAAGVLDIGLVYPRANETYEPTDEFPFVFALQNADLAEHLTPYIRFEIFSIRNSTSQNAFLLSEGGFEYGWGKFVENKNQRFYWTYLNTDGESQLRVLWQLSWFACSESNDDGLGVVRSDFDAVLNRTDGSFLVNLEIKDGGQKVDLIAATASDAEDCPNQGVSLNVTSDTHEIPARFQGRKESVTCAVLDNSSRIPNSNPCRAKIDQTVLESMQAADLEERCTVRDPPDECPEKDNVATKLAVAGGISFFAAVVGAALLLA